VEVHSQGRRTTFSTETGPSLAGEAIAIETVAAWLVANWTGGCDGDQAGCAMGARSNVRCENRGRLHGIWDGLAAKRGRQGTARGEPSWLIDSRPTDEDADL
jgi:hypothetical protein